MFCLNCLQIAFGFIYLFFSEYISGSFATKNLLVIMQWNIFSFFFFFNVLMFKEFAINILRLICNCM